MKKIKFTGTVDTFYFVPNLEEETAVIYLNVTSKQMCPNGKEEKIDPAQRMRFVLSEKELGILAKKVTIAYGDKLSIYDHEAPDGTLSHSVGSIENKPSFVDAKEYAKRLL